MNEKEATFLLKTAAKNLTVKQVARALAQVYGIKALKLAVRAAKHTEHLAVRTILEVATMGSR